MDLLYYRLPSAENTVRQVGWFESIQSGTAPHGFIVSDFLHQRLFRFNPDETGTFSGFHQSKARPVTISKRDYQIESQGMLHAFPVMGVEKAVYSRVKSVVFSVQHAEKLFEMLSDSYPKAFVYLISSVQFGTWIGATPELLLQQDGMQINTVALAGTKGVEEHRDWTTKEQQEHQFVTDHIVETLQRNQCVDIEIHGPFSVNSGPVAHLKTELSAILTAPNAWNLAMDLHPTPAVCGTPRMAALDLLLSREMHQRDLYAGIIGLNGSPTTNLFVNLRCAQLFENQAFLYVGGGYTIDSLPDLEWEETENKAKTLEKYMNLIQS